MLFFFPTRNAGIHTGPLFHDLHEDEGEFRAADDLCTRGNGRSLRSILTEEAFLSETRVPPFSFNLARRRVIPVSHGPTEKKGRKEKGEKKELRAFRQFSRGVKLTNGDTSNGLYTSSSHAP